MKTNEIFELLKTDKEIIQDLKHEVETQEGLVNHFRGLWLLELANNQQECIWKENDIGYYARVTLKMHEFKVGCRSEVELDKGYKFCPYCGKRIQYKWFVNIEMSEDES
jgi:hypothetical protein